jgi:nucleotide-binding universal stress UspA family protein
MMMPPRTILAATDFSYASIKALMFAARLANHCRAPLHVLHVEDPGPGAAPGQSGVDLSDSTRREMQRVIAAAAPDAGCALQVHAMLGSPAEVILETARARHADVVIVGGQSLSEPQKPGFGSIADELLRRTHLPVIVVPVTWEPPRQMRVGVQLPKEVKPLHQPPVGGWRRLVRPVNSPPRSVVAPSAVRADRAPLLVLSVRPNARPYTAAPVGLPYRMVSLGNAPVLVYMG